MYSQTVEYALRAAACLALRPNILVSTNTLARETKVPSNYLSKVLQMLAAAELIEGRRGVGGGYKLTREPSETTLLEIINAISPVKRITTCPLGLSNHGSNLCPLHRRSDLAAAAVIEIYGNTTLADLLANSSKPLCDTEKTARLTVHGTLAR